jgi:hypothetical protein
MLANSARWPCFANSSDVRHHILERHGITRHSCACILLSSSEVAVYRLSNARGHIGDGAPRSRLSRGDVAHPSSLRSCQVIRGRISSRNSSAISGRVLVVYLPDQSWRGRLGRWRSTYRCMLQRASWMAVQRLFLIQANAIPTGASKTAVLLPPCSGPAWAATWNTCSDIVMSILVGIIMR